MAYLLHPLVLTNVCDHLDRSRKDALAAGSSGASSAAAAGGAGAESAAPLCGLLFGLQTNQKVDICSSIEARVVSGGAASQDPTVSALTEAQWSLDEALIRRWIDMGEWLRRVCACAIYTPQLPHPSPPSPPPRFPLKCPAVKPIYPGHELLGWYAVADTLTPAHQAFHRQLCTFNEIPLLLHMRPSGLAPGMSEVPVTLCVGVQKGDDITFLPQHFVVDPSDTERGAVEHIFTSLTSGSARTGGGASSAASASASAAAEQPPPLPSSPAIASASSKLAALRILGERVALIKGFVDGLIADRDSGMVEVTTASASASSSSPAARKGSPMPALRSIRALLNRLPVEDAGEALDHEALDALLISTFAGVVAGTAGHAALLDKLSLLGGSFTEAAGAGGGGGRMGKLMRGSARHDRMRFMSKGVGSSLT